MVDYSFGDPDFDLRDFNSNLVVRWEYRPGSTVYFVWSQSRFSSERIGRNLEIGDDFRHLFDARGENVILIKFGKWLNP